MNMNQKVTLWTVKVMAGTTLAYLVGAIVLSPAAWF